MDITNSIVEYRRFLKRKNCSAHTVRSYLHALKLFVVWVNVPIEEVTYRKLMGYVDHLHARRLRPKTINCHLTSIRMFYDFLEYEHEVQVANPVRKGYALRIPKPLPLFFDFDDLAAFCLFSFTSVLAILHP